MAQLRDNYNPKEPIGSDAFNNIWENTRSFSVTKPKITKIYNNISNNDETKSLFMDKDVKDFRIANQSFFKNTYIDGSIDYFSMGVGDDFQFGKQDSLERLFIETDISNTSMANIYLAPGERIATYVKGRNADGDVQDMDKIRIVYSMDHPEIVSCDADGMLQANREGSAELTVTAILRGKTICTRLRIYTDAAAWEKENQVMADRPVHVFYNDKEINLDPGCYTEQGALFIPAAQVFEKMGYQTDLQDKNVIFSREGETVSFSGDDSVFRQNDKEIAMTDPARVRNGQLYVPFSIFEDLGLLSLYDDAERTAKIYRVNMASGSERIPERAEIVQLGELISDSAAWTQDITARYFNTGSMIRFGVDSAGGKQNILGYQKEKLTQNCMLAFECEWKSDTFVAIAMRVGDPTAIPWRTVDTGSYYVIIKPDTIEVQKRLTARRHIL